MRRWAWAAICVAAGSLSAFGAEPRKGEFLQDYITCELWMKREASAKEMHAAISGWVVDALRQHSPSRLSRYGDGEILDAVTRHCQAQPAHTLTVATFLAGLRFPE
ncbi:conserved exported hypothetical protein [Hyphomicrobiales bacterium]|nr:conserved exported hypothetical protein [Hyphomicrobiales bacterium]CAH1697891.1 conserved exported hypothetical protein [Hyphomicrobiales bacterium]CAI0347537.1 conserved exported hypothetical protein [Hyphomicrobiales bacterium]